MSEKIYFSLSLSRECYLRYYQGRASQVKVRAQDGRWVQLSAARLRAFVTGAGVHGRFCLELDETHRFIALTRLPER